MSKQITEISSDARQLLTITTDAQDTFSLELSYSDLQQAWFYNITFGDTVINGRRIVNAANILRAFRNVLPFGIAITSTDAGEPIFLDDFSIGRIELIVLEAEEVAQIETDIYIS